YKATEHLIQQGCTSIAHFAGAQRISIYRDRLRGYKDALIDYNLPFNESLVIESNLQLEDGRNSMTQLLTNKKIPDGIFSASAFGILGALQVLKERNFKIPQDIALVGFSNEPYTSFTEPSITTVEQHSLRMGNAAAEIFLEEVTDDGKKFIPQKIVLKPELIVRQSSMRKK
ncbi:MAG TPA: substrate-binding domain-containing protein, partial [Chryseolinea sp.]|nr:substrate-binding domain-containing protein [Chryseolinea sp.]